MKLFGKWRSAPPVAKEQDPFANAASVSTASADKLNGSSVGKNRKILVVDDNSVVLKAFDLKLKNYGFNVLTATDGSAAVSLARQEKPDLIVLDINFPPDVGSSGLQWNGFNIMEWIGRFKEVSHIPVVIITSEESAHLKEKALAAGAVAFFQKPINNDEFLHTIQKIFEPAAAA